MRTGQGTYQERGCLGRQSHPLLNGEASEVGSVRIGGVGGIGGKDDYDATEV